MKPRRIVRERDHGGLVLTRDVAGLPKGRILSDDDVRALESSSWSEWRPGARVSDVHEEARPAARGRCRSEGVEPGPVEADRSP